mgnify:CR=1 FL=1
MVKRRTLLLGISILLLVSGAALIFFSPSVNQSAQLPTSPAAIARGEYLVNAGGCVSCHLAVDAQGNRDDSRLSGGHALATDFGTFYAPNITPDTETGIGGWGAQDFLLA